jgi:putative hydrolase of HD superfamily
MPDFSLNETEMNRPNEDIKKLLDFLKIAGELKRTIRYSSDRGVLTKDSSADHSWRLALMAIIISELLNLKLNVYKAVKLALIHDLVESLTGDIDATDIGKTITKEKKAENERTAMIKLLAACPDKIKATLGRLWDEFEAGESREAKFVRALDKIETLTHLLETRYKGENFAQFTHAYGDEAVKNFSELTEILEAIKAELKNEFIKSGNWK